MGPFPSLSFLFNDSLTIAKFIEELVIKIY